MEFRIADTFTDSLGRLTREEQKAAKTTAFDLQLNPASPGMQFHRLDRARDKNFWSVRVSSDLRLIVHLVNATNATPEAMARLTGETSAPRRVLDLDVPEFHLPVAPGRSHRAQSGSLARATWRARCRRRWPCRCGSGRLR